MFDKKLDSESNSSNLSNNISMVLQKDIVQRYGSAVKEHLIAYSGTDYENNTILSKGLKDISKSKVNEKYIRQNLKQQAGFSAEVKTVAKENAEKAINGDISSRSVRTDDMKTQSNNRGGTIGGTNDQYADVSLVDKNGNFISNSDRQLKYVGENSQDCYKKLLSNNYKKYYENGTKVEIPSDYYDDVKNQISTDIKKLEDQIQQDRANGNIQALEKHQNKLEHLKKVDKSIQKGKISSAEAMLARVSPELSTALDVAKVSHRAGMQSAAIGVKVGFAVSSIRNLISIINDEKDVGDALVDIALDSSKSAAISYISGYSSTAIKGFMQNSKNNISRILSNSNFPSMITTLALNSGDAIYKFINGEIDGVEFLERLGQDTCNIVSSTVYATIGQFLIPIPVVGGFIGSIVGYSLSSTMYGTLLQTLREEKLSYEERVRVEKECEEQIKIIKKFRADLEALIEEYMSFHTQVFHESCDNMKKMLDIGDVDGFVNCANKITETLGEEVLFNNIAELDDLMSQDIVIKL